MGPLNGVVGVGRLVVAFFCAAILLLFVFAGVGVIVLGFFVLLGMLPAALIFPYLLPLLIPLAIPLGLCRAGAENKPIII
jgi:hypothetical protein